MNADLRASLLVGAFAAGLSTLVGIIAHVPFLPLLLRALFFGLLFGGLAWGVAFLLHSYLPELFDGPGNETEGRTMASEEGVDEALGGAVDIVLDDRDDEAYPDASLGTIGSAKAVSRQERADEAADEALDIAPMADFTGSSAAERPIVELAEEVEDSAETGGAVVPSRMSTGMDELDVLPDLDALAGSYGSFDLPSARVSDEGASSAATSGNESRSGSSTNGPGGSDPATLAAAVRTMLKRDQKG